VLRQFRSIRDVQAPPGSDASHELRAALLEIAERARELEELCRRAARLAEGPATPPAHEPDELDLRQASLLVAITLRGGTVEAGAFATLAERLAVPAAAVERLFEGPEPLLVRRGPGAAGVSERGLDAAAAWRDALPPELLRAATEP
jgi:phytoene/squalene synthetase